ncbi:hypothetical protein G7054_g11944 [Neopestalotiopsis clavispora]|nr:hypothetical protein G7054_g11944 [Neopestalotiopsis clavispora]
MEMNDSRPAEASATAPSWPLSFRATWSTVNDNKNNDAQQQHSQPPKPRWWTHTLYRGANGEQPKVLYSNTKVRSEEIAKEFLGATVLGFDMEWPWPEKSPGRLQDKVSLIQIATESKIALFHIALHSGNTVDELFAPSLKKIIDDPNVIKVGVKIQDADFARLRQHMGLQPRGGFELSHLYTLVKFGPSEPDKLRTNLVALARQVEDILGLPLSKDKSVRTSDWSRPLQHAQMIYAADDAYAGFMLYKCLDARRAQMQPTPPLPVLADHYKTYDGPGFPTRGAIRLQVPATASEYFARFNSRPSGRSGATRALVKSVSASGDIDHDRAEASSVMTGQNDNGAMPNMNPSQPAVSKVAQKLPPARERQLYYRLVERRQQYANELSFECYMIAHNSALESMSKLLPLNTEELLQVKGIGPKKVEQYGPGWLEVIKQFVKEYQSEISTISSDPVPHGLKRAASFTSSQKEEARAPPTLHTGLSFHMDQTCITDPKFSDDEDNVDSFGPPLDINPNPRISMQNGKRIDHSAGPHPPSHEELSTPRVKRNRSDIDHNDVAPPAQNPGPGSSSTQLHNPGTSSAGLQTRDFRRVRSYHQGTGNHSSQTAQEPPIPASQPTSGSHPRLSSNSNAAAVPRTLEERLKELSKQVSGGNPSILPAMTIRWIVTSPPASNQELMRVPGIGPFVGACTRNNINLLDTITKWVSD